MHIKEHDTCQTEEREANGYPMWYCVAHGQDAIQCKVSEVIVTGDSGVDYKIDVDGNGAARCSCPSFKYQTKWCKHLAFVYDNLTKSGASA